jgi:hypothetical protein
VSDADIEYSFFPYKHEGFPKVEGVEPGLVINQGNAEQFKHVLDPGSYQFVAKGELEIRVGETIDFELHPKFIEASKANRDISITNGNLANFTAGRPFPSRPNPDDPQAAEKIIWNYQYGRVWGDNGCMHPWYWDYKNMASGKIERTIKYDISCMSRFGFRTVDDPKPDWGHNPDGLYRGIYLRVEEPFDLKDTQLLIHKYKDDTRRFDGWIYLGFQRRVRRFATGQMTDAFLGSEIMIEDFEGYEGQVSEYTWTYKGEATLLMTMWDHNANMADKASQYPSPPNGYKYTPWTGKGGCFPDAPWMLRKVYIVEGSPKDASHPISKRVLYFDAQTNESPISLIYDRKGDYWKWFHIGWPHIDRHLDINKGKGAMIGDTAGLVDVQAQRCTTLSFNGVVDQDVTPPSTFAVQQLRSSGR